MQMNRPSKWKALLVALVFGSALVLAQAEKAHAFVDPLTIQAAAVLGVLAIAGTYAAVKATICTPVAAFKASDHAGGFGGAFKDCWNWSRGLQEAASSGTSASSQIPPAKDELSNQPSTDSTLEESGREAPSL